MYHIVIYLSEFTAIKDAVDSSREELPLFDAAFEFSAPSSGDGVGFTYTALANDFRPAFEPAFLFHRRKVRVEPSVGGLQHLMRQVGEFLPNQVAVQRAFPMEQC